MKEDVHSAKFGAWLGNFRELILKINSVFVFLVQALVLSPNAKRQATAGEIVNLMSVDAQKLQVFTSALLLRHR